MTIALHILSRYNIIIEMFSFINLIVFSDAGFLKYVGFVWLNIGALIFDLLISFS